MDFQEKMAACVVACIVMFAIASVGVVLCEAIGTGLWIVFLPDILVKVAIFFVALAALLFLVYMIFE